MLKLTAEQRKQLEKLGLFAEDGEPLWLVKKKYHWRQTFPAHKTIHIRHEYTPIAGGSNDTSYGMGPNPDPQSAKLLQSLCIDGKLREILQEVADSNPQGRGPGTIAPYSYVDFILTTANTWKTPIEDFTLIVERSHSKDSRDYVSFCWNGPVTRVDADHFSAHVVNLIPTTELRVGFFHVMR